MEAIQYIDECKHRQEAREVYGFLASQVDWLGGRILPPSRQVGKSRWRVQGFFSAVGTERNSILPDGCRFVTIPELLKQLGIKR